MLEKRKERNFYLVVFLVPSLVYVFFWRVGPLLYTISLSFTKYNFITDDMPYFIGVKNYQRAFLDPDFQHSLGISFLFMGTATFAELLIGLGLAVFFDRAFKGKNIFLGILLIPMVLAPVATGLVWYILYNDMIGPINQILKYVGFPRPQWISSQSTALFSIVIADIWQWTPFMFLLLLSALQSVPIQLHEAAKIDGASGFKIFRYITFPLIIDMMLIAVILRSMDAFRAFGKIWLMTRGGPATATEVVSIRVYKTAFQYFDMGYAAAMVVLILIVISSLYIGYLKLVKV